MLYDSILILRVSLRGWKLQPRVRLSVRQSRWITTANSPTSDVVTLQDGRNIGLAYYGVKSGPNVFYLHGRPGSRLEGKILEPPATKLGVSILAVDRPGIGLSSPQANRTIADHAEDVKDLAAVLGIKEYYVVGVSAGGPYALACALSHPASSLRGVAVAAGLGPPQFGLKGMTLRNRMIYGGLKYCPRILRLLTEPLATSQLKKSDEELLKYSMSRLEKANMPEKDRKLFTDPDILRPFIASAREHFRQGFDASMQDGQLLSQDWGFRIEDIRFRPIKLWFASQDVNIAACTGPELKRLLGDQATLRIEEESHASLVFNCGEKILADLVNSAGSEDKLSTR